MGTFPVVANYTRDTDSVVTLANAPTEQLLGRKFKLYDDDDNYRDLLRLWPLPLNRKGNWFVDGIQAKFGDAYMLIQNANMQKRFNPHPVIEFQANALTMDDFSRNIFDKNRDLPRSLNAYWTWLFVFGYEAVYGLEGDPDVPVNHLLGLTTGYSIAPNYSTLFVETCRDFELMHLTENYLSERSDYFRKIVRARMLGVVAHEIGHGPGGHAPGIDVEKADHSELGLMQGPYDIYSFTTPRIDEESFSGATIKRFRGQVRW